MGPYYLTAIAALLGPIARVAGFATTSRRERDDRDRPAHRRALPRVDSDAHDDARWSSRAASLANLVASFEARAASTSATSTIHGSEGVLVLPDPNNFEGTVRLKRGRGGWEDVPYASRGARDARGIGLQDMVDAIREDRPHRASGLLGAHVVEVVRGILRGGAARGASSRSSRGSRCPRRCLLMRRRRRPTLRIAEVGSGSVSS